MANRYILGAYWPPRQEGIDECADRLAQCLLEFGRCDRIFGTWFEKARSRQGALERPVDPEDRSYLIDLLDRGRNRRDVGQEIMDELGFNVGLWNGVRGDREASLSVTCGLYWKSKNPRTGLSNKVIVTLPRELQELGQAETMARILAVVAESWAPAWAGVMSLEAMNARKFDPEIPFVDWMTYIPSKLAKAPSPPSILQLNDLGSIVVVQPTPPSTDNPEELIRIKQVEGLFRK